MIEYHEIVIEVKDDKGLQLHYPCEVPTGTDMSKVLRDAVFNAGGQDALGPGRTEKGHT